MARLVAAHQFVYKLVNSHVDLFRWVTFASSWRATFAITSSRAPDRAEAQQE
jgi:hypothetical protein